MQSFILFFYHDGITKVSKESGSFRGTSDIGINKKYIFEMTNMSKKYLIININLIRQIMHFQNMKNMAVSKVLTVNSFHCRGLREKTKRQYLFNWLTKSYNGVIFLQETHCTGVDELK